MYCACGLGLRGVQLDIHVQTYNNDLLSYDYCYFDIFEKILIAGTRSVHQYDNLKKNTIQ